MPRTVAPLAVSSAGTLDEAPIELVIESISPVNGGVSYGSVGPYERLRGYALGELDPTDPANQRIVNLDQAPRNAVGKVEYRVDVEIQRPVDLAKANGTMLYEVVNRGRQLIFGYVNRGTPLLYESGFTLVWSGWQGDISPQGENLIGSFPIATNDGEPVVGISREEFVDRGTSTWTGTLSYPAATLDPDEATLTVRQNERDPRVPVSDWRYVDGQQIEVQPPGAPYDSGAIFEFIYPARDPIVTGIGFAATRDVNSYLRFGGPDSAGNPNPLGPEAVENALALGISQSGRFLRDFIHQGFNEDLQGRRVFEGAMPIIAGSRKTWVNYEFAQPGRWSKQHEDHLQRGDQFPFAYNTIRDPLTGVTDGVLAECRMTATCPKIMHVDGEFEVWGARGSLLVTDGNPDKPKDLPIPDDVRLYMVAGTPHGGSNTIVPETPSFGICQQANTPLGSSAVIRALLLRLDRWVEHGVRPPRTDYGSAEANTLVTSDRDATGFPEIPGVTYNGLFNYLHVTDYTTQPPAEGAEYGVRVPRVDRDGNSLAGIRLPAVQVPVATYTGWNLRAEGHAEGEVCSSAGSFIPLPQTLAERRESGDPRRSIEERYRNHDDYVRQFGRAAEQLVHHGYLLQVDADAMVAEATEN
ncbi:MAG: alpha/beta hydrolase domain-containing protein [Nocardioidaceae bacterium]